jgi:uncharacterized caspase-like protein
MKTFKWLLFSGLTLSMLWGCANNPVSLTQQPQEKRIALVMGNNKYISTDPLTLSVKDAKDVATILSKQGFTVHYGTDLSTKEMRQLLKQFTDKIDEQTLSLVYYSGHGVSNSKGMNFLVPVDYNPTKTSATGEQQESNLVAVDEVAFSMKGKGSNKNVLLLDMCRNDPAKAKGGELLASYKKSIGGGDISTTSKYNLNEYKQDGILISYSTGQGDYSYEAPDPSSLNSVYTISLLKNLVNDKLSLSDLLSRVNDEVHRKTKGTKAPQNTWKSGSLSGDDIFLAIQKMKSDLPPRP